MYEFKALEFLVNAENDKWKHYQLLGLHQLLTKCSGEYCKRFCHQLVQMCKVSGMVSFSDLQILGTF